MAALKAYNDNDHAKNLVSVLICPDATASGNSSWITKLPSELRSASYDAHD